MKFYLFLIFTFVGIIITSLIPSVDSHSFYTNKDSVFYTLVKRYQVENFLTSQNQTNSKSMAVEHSQNAAVLLKELVSLSNDTKIATNLSIFDSAFSNVALSTRALVAADLADETLKQYGLAKGLDPRAASDLKVMSMGMIMNMYRLADKNATKMGMGQMSESSMTESDNNQSLGQSGNLSNIGVINEVNYGTSSMLAKSLKTIFTDNLENSVLQNSTGLMRIPMNMKRDSVDSLGQGIDNLIQAVNSKASLEEVFSIVHGQIHPNLYLAYDLKLKGD